MEKIETGQDRDEFVPDLEFPQIRQGHPKQGRRGERQDPQRERGIDRKSINHEQGRSYEEILLRGRFPGGRKLSTLGAPIPNSPDACRARRQGLSAAEYGGGRPKVSSGLFDLACRAGRGKGFRSPTLTLLQL